MRRSTVKTYRIATIPGDGIGKEVVPAGKRVLEAIAARSNECSAPRYDIDYLRREPVW